VDIMNDMKRYGSIVAAVCASILPTTPAAAEVLEWTNPLSGNFSDPGNWTVTTGIGPPPPASGDTANFNEVGTYTVTLTQDEATDLLNVTAGDVTLMSDSPTLRTYSISNGAADANINGGSLTIGQTNSPVRLNLGNPFASALTIGNGADGGVTVQGAGSSLSAAGFSIHRIGDAGASGSLSVIDAAAASVGTLGTLRVGVSSNAATTGTILVDTGGSLDTGDLFIATNTSAATGSVTVNGAGSSIDQTTAVPGNTLSIGSASGGAGTLNVTNGGTFTAGTGLTTINATGTLNITNSTFNANGPITMSGGGTLSLDDGTLNTNAGLDNSAGGTLNFFGGTLTVAGGVFTPNAGGAFALAREGAVSVSPPHLVVSTGATANLGTSFDVGKGAQAEFTISGGGQVFSSNVTGIGVTTFGIGGIEEGSGTVTVTGSDGLGQPSRWTNGGLVVGSTGDGSLTIDGGGEVDSSGFAAIGQVNTGTATVSGAGSKWTNSGDLTVGNIGGTGSLAINSGAEVTNATGIISSGGGSTGTVTISDTGSKWINSGGLFVGGNSGNAGGTGTVIIQNNAFVEVAGSFKIWNPGTVNFEGGTLKIDSTTVVVDGSFNYLTGTFHLTDAGGYTVGANSGPIDQVLGFADVTIPNGGGLIVDQNLIVPFGTSLTAVSSIVTANGLTNDGLINVNTTTITTTAGLTNNADMVLINTTVQGPVNSTVGSTVTVLGTVDFNGPVTGPGNFFGPGTANFNGGMAPGASPAEVGFEGDVALGNGNTLFVELGGTTPGTEYDRLSITGSASLGGTLDVSLLGGFNPVIGDTFDILVIGLGVLGTFDGVQFPAISNLGLGLIYGSNTVTLSAGLPGDLNFDGFVGIADLNIVLGGWNQNVNAGVWALGDPSGDGFIGIEDLNIVLGNWNVGTPPAAQAPGSVPQPGTFALTGVLVSIGALRRTGQRQPVPDRGLPSAGLNARP
jgi:T5SS/PEP-CTERM-associated repeat protein